MKKTSSAKTTLRSVPSIDQLVSSFTTSSLEKGRSLPPRTLLVAYARDFIDGVREKIRNAPDQADAMQLDAAFVSHVAARNTLQLQRVINATGVLIHTNLGRAPLPQKTLENVIPLLFGYTNLEYDLTSGERGKRGADIETSLSVLCGSESSTVTNNCAAALVLIVNTFAQKKEIIISRSELVQIGGGFRIPDILQRAGAKLREVGTTNITTLDDYASALSDKTAMILKVHQSNFIQHGFESNVSLADLSTLAGKSKIPLVYDLGSGLLDNRMHPVLSSEPTTHSALQSGADLICFSGDKLLGGPQSGIIIGKSGFVEKIKKNPLFRAFRLDKCSLALLAEVVRLYLDKRESDIPIWRMLGVKESDLCTRARTLIESLGSPKNVTVESCHSQIGGGALPEKNIPSVALCIRGKKGKQIATALRQQSPPVIARIQDETVLLDLRTVDPTDDHHLVSALNQILSA
jgi:L-seryl-tRNA(Ser) seleniumtransferase